MAQNFRFSGIQRKLSLPLLPWTKKPFDKQRSNSAPNGPEPQVPPVPTTQLLPYEIINLIFHSIPTNTSSSSQSLQTMCQCALVSRSCRSLIQPTIFSTIYLHSKKRCLTFLSILLENPHLPKYIRELYIAETSAQCDEKICPLSSSALPHILSILAEAPQGTLHSVRFRCLDNGVVEYERRQKLPRGSILTIYGGKYRGTRRKENWNDSDENLSESAPASTSTSIAGEHTNTVLVTQTPKKRSSLSLKSLGLGGLESMNILDFLRGPHCPLDVSNLTQLTVYSVDPHTLAAVRSVVKQSGASLERMLIHPPSSRLDYWLAESLPRRILDLTTLDKLRDFAFFLRQPGHLGRNFLAWVAGNRFPNKLESISVIMHVPFSQCLLDKEEDRDGRDFKYLDASLVGVIKDQIVGGCEVWIYVVDPMHCVTERMIRDALPRIDVTGMLRVEILRTLGANYLPSVDFTVYIDDRRTNNT